jgi:BirA family transcriptional regulator, biotin operon repressor / biotin---[acetyl-CoA-carboxylase] ligase
MLTFPTSFDYFELSPSKDIEICEKKFFVVYFLNLFFVSEKPDISSRQPEFQRVISEASIQNNLSAHTFGKKIYSFDSIPSTNTFAKSLRDEEASHGTLVISDEQTAGKGRLGRRWDSEKGSNLLFSLVFRPSFDNDKSKILPFVASLAVCDAIEQETGLEPECKWPNDVLVNKKKVCGILMETSVTEGAISRIVLGIGINVNQKSFGQELATTATSLYLQSSGTVDRVGLLQKNLVALERRYDQLARFPVHFLLEEWKQRTTMFGKTISVTNPNTFISARAIGITDEGALVIQSDDGEKRNIFAGDVSIRF